MRKSPRTHLTYANVTATLALVFAMSGGALAAKHYLINSTKQISPKVLKALKGKTGKAGAIGKEGPAGKDGAPGAPGATGKEGLRGADGAPGSALAYAHVNADGTLDTEHTSSNVQGANVRLVGTGLYEFTGLPFPVHSVDVTLGFGNPVNSDVEARVLGNSSAEVGVRDSKGLTTDANFYVVFN